MIKSILKLIKVSLNGRTISVAIILTVVILLSGCVNAPNKTSPQFKVRALWVDPPGFKDRETIDRLIEKCQKAGLNTILPDIMLRENVWFKSVNFAGKVNADEQFDPLAYLIEKAHAAGIKVQPWSCTYYSIAKHPEWVSKPFVYDKYEHVFLSPAHPDVNPYLLSVLKELLKYDIDGLHLDYTRYWNAAFDYSDVARNRFKAAHGFDPQDFLDHPERIVSPDKDTYPIRVLCTKAMATNVWQIGTIERDLNHIGVGFAFISEQPANIDALKAPGLLIINYCDEASTIAIVDALERYVKRGGDVIWINPVNDLFRKYRKLSQLTGIAEACNSGAERVKFNILNDYPFGKPFDSLQLKVGGNFYITREAKTIARLNTGEPFITIHQKGKGGSVMSIGFQLMNCNTRQVIPLLKDIVIGFRTQAGITGPDLMAEKRKLWIDWRTDQILDFVRNLNKMVKEKNPKLLITAAAGVGPYQFYSIYRDAGNWLVENIADYIFPMNYTNRVDDFQDILEEQILYTPDGTSDRIYPGLQIYSKDGKVPIDATIVDQQLDLVKKHGYQGFCLFAYSFFSDEIVEVAKKYSQQ